MRRIKLGDFFFVINPSNGRWGIANPENVGELEVNLDTPLPQKEYTGVELIVINSSNICNLGCVYCSESRHRGTIPSMPLEVAYRIIDRVAKQQNPAKIVFHGSEPLCNFDWIKKVIIYGRTNVSRRINFSIQSNLAYLPQGFLDFIQKYGVGVSTSIDGSREIHDRTRPYREGGASFDDVMGNARRILAMQRSLNIASVVTRFNVNHLEEIGEMFEAEGFSSWQTIPVQRNPELAPNPRELGQAYIRLFEKTFERLKRGEQRLEIRALAQYLSSLFNANGIDACRLCSSAEVQPLIAVDYNGLVYPCDYFWGESKAEMGSILQEDIAEVSFSSRNLRRRDIEKTSCSSCTWRMNCGGGCLAETVLDSRRPFYCTTHQQVYFYLARKMPELITESLIKPALLWLSK